MKAKIFSIVVCVCLMIMMLSVAIPGECLPPPSYDLDFSYSDGSDHFVFDTLDTPYAYDHQALKPKFQIESTNYLIIENIGGLTFETFYFNLTSFTNGVESIDISGVGMWAIDYGDISHFTPTVDETFNTSISGVEGDVVDSIDHLIEEDGGGQQINKKIHSYNEEWRGNGKKKGLYRKYAAIHERKIADSPIVFNYTLDDGAKLYIRPILLLDNMPVEGSWSLNHECLGYDSYESYTSLTRAVASDTQIGTSTMQISSTTAFTVSYTGTQTSYVYFTKLFGGVSSTVTSINNFRITNTGNEVITSVEVDVGTIAVWEIVSSGADTSYYLSNNVYFKRNTISVWEQCNPSGVAITAIGLGGIEDFDMQIRNEPDLPVESYQPSINPTITCNSIAGPVTGSLDMRYVVSGGTLACSITYTSGSGVEFPNSDPGDTFVYQTNQAYLNNLGSSDYPIDKMEFLFSPMVNGLYNIGFGDNAEIALIDPHGGSWIFPLVSFIVGTETYGRAYIEFDDFDPLKPPLCEIGESYEWWIRITQIPVGIAPGAYTGTFTITSAYNPVIILGGTTGFGVDLTDDILDFDAVFSPIDPVVNETVKITFDVFTASNTTLFGDYHIVLIDKENNDVVIIDKIVNNITYSELENTTRGNRRTCLNSTSFTPNHTGDYEVQINYTVLNPITEEWEDLEFGNKTTIHVEHNITTDKTTLNKILDWIDENLYLFMILLLMGGVIIYLFAIRKK